MKQQESLAKNVIQLEEFYQASNLKAKEYSITFNTLKEVLGECYQYQLHPGFQNTWNWSKINDTQLNNYGKHFLQEAST